MVLRASLFLKTKFRFWVKSSLFLFLSSLLFLVTGCGSAEPENPENPDQTEIPITEEETPADSTEEPANPIYLPINPLDATTKIARGIHHTCGLTDGQAYCWGDDSSDQLKITQRDDYKDIVSGWNHACGLTENGEVYCWGDEKAGKKPVSYGLGKFLSISAGRHHTCGINTAGQIRCWGDNTYRQLMIPDRILGLENIQKIKSKGDQSCVMQANGSIFCWGTPGHEPDPSVNFTEFALGNRHGCGITTGGSIECWGDYAFGKSLNQPRPAVGNYIQLSLGENHSCALIDTGEVICWGDNAFGQLEAIEDRYLKLSTQQNTVCGLTTGKEVKCWGEKFYVQIAIGDHFNCAITDRYRLKCWGYSPFGELDIPSEHRESSFFKIKASQEFACGLLFDEFHENGSRGRAVCWGENRHGKSTVPDDLRESYFVDIALGNYHACGILADDRKLRCWGNYGYSLDTDHPVGPPEELQEEAVLQIAAGMAHTCVILASNRQVRCWGYDDQRIIVPEPYRNRSFYQISSYRNHTCGLLVGDETTGDDGHVICWNGRRTYDWAGPTDYDLNAPEAYQGYAFHQISVGNNRFCGLLKEGVEITDEIGTRRVRVLCWAEDNHTFKPIPREFESVVFSQLEGGKTSLTCGLAKASKQFSCWGQYNNNLAVVPDRYTNKRFLEISAGRANICGLIQEEDRSEIACWGTNRFSQIDIAEEYANEDQSFLKISVSVDHICGILEGSNLLRCWGSDTYGKSNLFFDYLYDEEGDGVNADRSDIRTFDFSEIQFSDLTTGYEHTCARFLDADQRTPDTNPDPLVDTSKRTLCWGIGYSYNIRNVPADFVFSKMNGGRLHTCGILADAGEDTGKMHCWGRFYLDYNDPEFSLYEAYRNYDNHLDSHFYDISSGFDFSCGILEDTRYVICWGEDAESRASVPEAYQAKRFSQITTGLFHTCGILEDSEVEEGQGNVVCWGDGGWGQRIEDTPYFNKRFVKISAAVGRVTCGILDDREIEEGEGNLVCWGRGDGRLLKASPLNQ